MHIPNRRAPKSRKKTLTELKRETDIRIITGDFNIPLSRMHRTNNTRSTGPNRHMNTPPNNISLRVHREHSPG